jgi:hypothetical protein
MQTVDDACWVETVTAYEIIAAHCPEETEKGAENRNEAP